MATSIAVASLEADRVGAWQEFQAELTGPRRAEWAQSQRRRGITRELVFLLETPACSAVYVFEGTEADAALEALEGSSDPFDEWLLRRLAELHGDLIFPERVYDTRPGPGAWRGWLGWSGRSQGEGT